MSDLFQWTSSTANAEQWMAHLRQGNPALTSEQRDAIIESVRRANEQRRVEAPLYLRALTGIGAIISGFLVIYLLYLFDLFDDQPLSLCLNGLGLMVAAMVFYRSGTNRTGLAQDFSIQLGLTLLQAGKIAVVSGLVQYFEPVFDIGWFWPIAAAFGTVGAISFLLFPLSLERFLAAVAFFVALWVAVVADGPTTNEALLFTTLILLHILGLAAFLKWSIWRRHLTALYDALLVSLCIGVGIVATYVDWAAIIVMDVRSSEVGGSFSGFWQKWPTQILLTLSLLALVTWAGYGRWKVKPNGKLSEPLLVVIAGILLLGLLSDPGILLAMGLLILGYATHRSAHVILGLLFAIGFGVRFYYALDLTLLEKSVILTASGLLLLAAAGFMYRKGWHQAPGMSAERLENQSREVYPNA